MTCVVTEYLKLVKSDTENLGIQDGVMKAETRKGIVDRYVVDLQGDSEKKSSNIIIPAVILDLIGQTKKWTFYTNLQHMP